MTIPMTSASPGRLIKTPLSLLLEILDQIITTFGAFHTLSYLRFIEPKIVHICDSFQHIIEQNQITGVIENLEIIRRPICYQIPRH